MRYYYPLSEYVLRCGSNVAYQYVTTYIDLYTGGLLFLEAVMCDSKEDCACITTPEAARRCL
jgi:hypothetical protein